MDRAFPFTFVNEPLSMLLFFNISGGELFLIMLLTLLFFGADSIPKVARGLGKGIRQFREAAGSVQHEIRKTGEDVRKDYQHHRRQWEDRVKQDPLEQEGEDKTGKGQGGSGDRKEP